MGAVITALQIAFVFVLLAVFAWGMKRIGGRRAPAGLVSVPVRAPLTGRASLTVATVAGKAYVLGVTEQQVTVIDIRDAAELELATTAADTAEDGPASGDDPSSPPNTLGAALVYAAAHAKKAWAARRSVPATTDQATPEQAAAWDAAWNGASPQQGPQVQDVPQVGAAATAKVSPAASALAPVPVKRSKSTKTTKASQQARARKAVTA
ncbi:flagellar biosynthetic protein FliO [Paenarthrobacter sp. C1]|uniref:flagellar biosynthetic protein FliO n=1 Tax=Paenarthrobacter sp. C1 TaxID=3400220 RepID=UPI003BF5692B